MKNQKVQDGLMKHAWLLMLVAFLGIGSYGQEIAIDWGNIMEVATTYFAVPSSENALRFYNALPKVQVQIKNEEEAFSKVNSYIFSNLVLLEKQVLKADRNSVKVAVRLWTIADGAFAEDLSDMLGQLIQIAPKMFLEETRDFPWSYHGHEGFLEWLKEGHIVCNGGVLGGEVEYDEQAVRAELLRRIQALETVKEKDLMEFRDICINIIKQHIPKHMNSAGSPCAGQKGQV